MAWWWGRRWRRRPWGRWRRRRRVWKRRPRTAVRRRRGRRYVSRRRRYRRRLRRRGRRRYRGRRKKRQTLVLRQWQPDVNRLCRITGWLPLIVCGTGRAQDNFIVHSEDITPRGAAYGGNLTHITWCLEAIYQEFLMHRNRWSRSNHDLDLCRYQGVVFKAYRHPKVDYIIAYTRTPPFQVTELSYMSCHPLLMLTAKHRIVVKSLETKKGGKKYVKFRIRPPRLMLNKWYFTHDFCKVPLFSMWASACDLRNPWLREGALSPTVGFFALKPDFYPNLSILPAEIETQAQFFYGSAHPPQIQGEKDVRWEYTYTNLMKPIYNAAPDLKASTFDWENYSNPTNYSKCYQQYTQHKTARFTKIKKEYQTVYPTLTTQTPQNEYLTQEFGIYSPYFLTPVRISLDWHTVFHHIRYNPMADKGLGNMIWVDWCSRKEATYDPTRSKCMLKDLPLYMLFYGYCDWVTKSIGSETAWRDMRVMVVCPYTEPQLMKKTDKTYGYVIYGYNFANGNMPFLQPYVPISWFCRWFPCITHQREAMESVVATGPFMVRDQDRNSWDITVGYKFLWRWGGSPLPTQAIDDPCQQGTHPLPEPGTLPRILQVSDPTQLGPKTIFHLWDQRRGLFSKRSIERVSEYKGTDDLFSPGRPKRPKLDTRPEGLPEEQRGAYNLLQALQDSAQSEESDQEEMPPLEEEQVLQEQKKEALLQQLQQQKHHQRVLKRGLRLLLGDVLKLRRGLHIDPVLT
nr:MAG: ORF1 [Torque teno virus]